MGKKVIFIRTEQGRSFEVDLSEVARDRANYYSQKDSDFESEFNFVMNDDYEGIDWLQNNMDFYNCETIKEVTTVKDVSELDIDDCDIIAR